MNRKSANPGNPTNHPSISEAVRSVLDDEAVLGNLSFELDVLECVDARLLDFTRCTFRRVQFADLRIDRTHFTDCRFEQCDLSGLPFIDGTMTRVEFIGCRGTGAHLDRMKIKDVLFENCQMNYLTLSDCKAERMEFSGCDLSHMMLFSTNQKELVFDRCNLRSAEISGTPLGGVDLSTCDLEGIVTHGEMLRGTSISLSQAPSLLNLFGIRVKL